jgi:KaiC/GvpD/RAD55 family RecA-like ATPase
MGQFDEGGQAKKEEGLFDSLLRNLDKAVCQATIDAETYKKYINKIHLLILDADLKSQEKELSLSPTVSGETPDNVITKLKALLGQLEATNSKNAEILKHFDTLV